MNILKGAIFLLIVAAAIGFAVKNNQPVSLEYFFGWVSTPLPLFLWAFISFFIGLVISSLIASLTKVGLHSRIRLQKKKIVDLERKRSDIQK